MRRLVFAENINGTKESGLIDMSNNSPEIFCLCKEEKAQEIQNAFNSVNPKRVEKLLSALQDIQHFDEDMEEEWEDAGYRAKAALIDYYKNK